MNIMNNLPIELKNVVMGYLPIITDNMKLLHIIIKNYKYYFIKALYCEYNKYYKNSFFLYIEMCLLEWTNSINIFKRIVSNLNINKSNIIDIWLSLFKNKWNYTECKMLILDVFKECTLLETQQLYLFITHSLSSFSMSSSNTSISSSISVSV